MQQPNNPGTDIYTSNADDINPNAPPPPGLIDYIEIIVKRRKMIAGITVTVTLATVIYALGLVPRPSFF